MLHSSSKARRGVVTASGEKARLRGVTIAGNLSANGNDFGISFSVVKGNTDIRGNAGAFLRNVFCGTATVPSSNAKLLDNYGIEPTSVRVSRHLRLTARFTTVPGSRAG